MFLVDKSCFHWMWQLLRHLPHFRNPTQLNHNRKFEKVPDPVKDQRSTCLIRALARQSNLLVHCGRSARKHANFVDLNLFFLFILSFFRPLLMNIKIESYSPPGAYSAQTWGSCRTSADRSDSSPWNTVDSHHRNGVARYLMCSKTPPV